MFTKASFRKFRHKTKKGMMKRIGKTESQPEDPKFKNLLATLTRVKAELKDMYNTFRNVATSGKKYNENLEKFCGAGSEDVFYKEAEFLNTLEERVCTELWRIVVKDINKLNELIIQYKTAKLNFDSVHFKTVKKRIKKNLAVGVEQADEIMEENPALPALLEAYNASKDEVREHREVIWGHLTEKVGSKLEELREVSDAEHHQLYCRFFKERLAKLASICSGDDVCEEPTLLVRSATFSFHRTKGADTMKRSFSIVGAQKQHTDVLAKRAFSAPVGNGGLEGDEIPFSSGNGLMVDDEKNTGYATDENILIAPDAPVGDGAAPLSADEAASPPAYPPPAYQSPIPN